MIRLLTTAMVTLSVVQSVDCASNVPAGLQAIYTRQLADCEAALSANPIHAGPSRFGLAARAAFELAQYDKARTYAIEGLESVRALSPRMLGHLGGNTIFYGHWVLGRLALMDGDIGRARQELVLAGTSPGSALLQSFGPSMRLASDLLAQGGAGPEDRTAVIGFLEGCSHFWQYDGLQHWIVAVQKGGAPQFPPSLLN